MRAARQQRTPLNIWAERLNPAPVLRDFLNSLDAIGCDATAARASEHSWQPSVPVIGGEPVRLRL